MIHGIFYFHSQDKRIGCGRQLVIAYDRKDARKAPKVRLLNPTSLKQVWVPESDLRRFGVLADVPPRKMAQKVDFARKLRIKYKTLTPARGKTFAALASELRSLGS